MPRVLLPWSRRDLCARRWLQSVPSRSVLDAVRLLARPANSRGLWRLAKEGWGRVHQRQAARSEDEVTSAAHREGPRNSELQAACCLANQARAFLTKKTPSLRECTDYR